FEPASTMEGLPMMIRRTYVVITDHAQQGGMTSCPSNSWRVQIALHYKPDVYSLTMVRADGQDVLSQSTPFRTNAIRL
ncbi:MAG TPA: hypothetical protein VN647_10370, partial [Nitrospira sp.]|nr:hypothetical protein [Nitrospira sp.]